MYVIVGISANPFNNVFIKRVRGTGIEENNGSSFLCGGVRRKSFFS